MNVARFFGVVAEYMADFADSGVDTMFGVDEDLALPKALGYFFACGELSVFLREEYQQLERLAFQAQALAGTH